MDCSENITRAGEIGGGFSIFASKIWVSSFKDWQNLDASLSELGKSVSAPKYIYIFKPLYMCYMALFELF